MTEAQSAERDLRRKMMLEDSVVKVIPLVAIPTIISMLIDSIYNITDAYFVSWLGTTATAAVGVNSSLLHILRSVAIGFGMGAASYISRLLGAKRDEEANRVGTTTLFTGMIALMAISLIGYIFMRPMVRIMGATDTVMPYSMDYARWILISSPFTAGSVILSQLLRSEGSTKYSMIGMVSGCVVNIGLDPLFISVFGLEVAGAAIATGISKLTSFIILLIPFLRKKTILGLKLRFFTPTKETYLEIAKMGIPNFLRSSMLAVSGIVVNNIAGTFSDAVLAAVTIANKATRFIGSAIIGLSQGFQPVVGYNWGAKKYARVRKAFWACTVMGVGASVVLGAILAVFAERFVGIFTSSGDLEILQLGSYMIITQCITMGLHTWGAISNSLFVALGRSAGATILGLSRQMICLLPCVLILSKVFGAYGLASAHAASDILTFIVALLMTVVLYRKIKRIEYKNNMSEFENQPDNTQPQMEHEEVISI